MTLNAKMLTGAMLAAGLAFLTSTAQAERSGTANEVDLELVLAADMSASMMGLEYRQRMGFVEAFRSEGLYRAISSGFFSRIAVVYYEWSDHDSQRVIVPWTLIETREDMTKFADALDAAAMGRTNRETSISGALAYAQKLLGASPYEGDRSVIDISGNGLQSDGPPVEKARKVLIAEDVTVNGLVLSDKHAGNETIELTDYFMTQIIVGPAAFVITVGDRKEYAHAIFRKLILEVASSEVAPISLIVEAEGT